MWFSAALLMIAQIHLVQQPQPGQSPNQPNQPKQGQGQPPGQAPNQPKQGQGQPQPVQGQPNQPNQPKQGQGQGQPQPVQGQPNQPNQPKQGQGQPAQGQQPQPGQVMPGQQPQPGQVMPGQPNPLPTLPGNPQLQPPLPQVPQPQPQPTEFTKPTEQNLEKYEYPKAVGGKTLAEWVKELNESKDGAVRELAVKAIPQFGPSAREPSLKALLKACKEDIDPGVRVNAILTLGVIGANNKEEAKQILEALRIAISNSGIGGVVRLHATKAISNYGNFIEQANDAIPVLENISKDPSWETRKSVAYTLGQISGPTKSKPELKPVLPGQKPPDVDPKTGPNPKTLKILLSMLNDSSATVRLEVVQAMTFLGPPAVNPEVYSQAVTPYMQAISDRTKSEKDKSILIWLHMLSMRLDGNQFNETTIQKIVDLGRGAEPEHILQALNALGILGERALVPGLPFGREQLRHSDAFVIASAAQFLSTLGDKAKPALPDLDAAKAKTKDELLKKIIDNAVDTINGKKPVGPAMADLPKNEMKK